uniref:Uncharacterized protein n=1 Tax=Arundo donax TaxID=35708 RepID=A0A0A9A101_ARUDO
MLIEQEVGIS